MTTVFASGKISGEGLERLMTPKFFPELDYEITMEMTYWGARVLHYRCVELAERKNIPLLVHLSSEEGQGTVI